MRQPGFETNLALKNMSFNCKHSHSNSPVRFFKEVIFFFTALQTHSAHLYLKLWAKNLFQQGYNLMNLSI